MDLLGMNSYQLNNKIIYKNKNVKICNK